MAPGVGNGTAAERHHPPPPLAKGCRPRDDVLPCGAPGVRRAIRGGSVMRRPFGAVLLVPLLVVGLLGVRSAGPVRAQDATPRAGMMAPPGVTFTLLGIAPRVTVPNLVDLTVARAT